MLDFLDGATSAQILESFPPFLYLGVRVLELTDDWGRVRILLPLNRDTMNPGGSVFGGSIAALADPIPALASNRRFPGYAVWTRELTVDFRRPGMTDLELRFDFPPHAMGKIARELSLKGRSTPLFEFGLYDTSNQVVAWVNNRVAIRPIGAEDLPSK
ncbi:MAG: PaaI family thioesterase [Candidatus Thiodiazotropha sp. (ex Ustalcina ferruginea)]|nr:PaaI family thioesterase [Candidatus Thiodiazotropha sp. (ex Ustalcina ferruginea)]